MSLDDAAAKYIMYIYPSKSTFAFEEAAVDRHRHVPHFRPCLGFPTFALLKHAPLCVISYKQIVYSFLGISKHTSLTIITSDYSNISRIIKHHDTRTPKSIQSDRMHAPALLSCLLATTITAFPSPHTDTTDIEDAPEAPPSLDEFLSSPMTFEKRQENSSALPDATVQLCTEPNFRGQCTHATWTVNQCIDLRGHAGLTESFLPSDGFECLLMQ